MVVFQDLFQKDCMTPQLKQNPGTTRPGGKLTLVKNTCKTCGVDDMMYRGSEDVLCIPTGEHVLLSLEEGRAG